MNSIYDIFDNLGIRIALIGVLSILALYLLAQTIATTQNFGRSGVPATDTVTVTGDGQAALAPDVARVSFTIENTAVVVTDAQAATTKQVNAALAFVKEQGIADKDVKTLSYNISPQYAYSPHPSPCYPGGLCPPQDVPKLTGYQVSETVQVTMRELSTVGALLGGLGKLGVQNVNGPSFALDDPTEGYSAARADAINKAKTQATLLADQLGVRLGKIVNFSESSGGYNYSMYSLGMSEESGTASTPNVPAGENTYNASVSITYEIR